jgi:hypothetical protein
VCWLAEESGHVLQQGVQILIDDIPDNAIVDGVVPVN